MTDARKYLKSSLGRTIEEIKKAMLSHRRICFLVCSDVNMVRDIIESAALLPNSLGDLSDTNDTPPTPTVCFTEDDTFVKSTLDSQTKFDRPRIFVCLDKPHYLSGNEILEEQAKLPINSLVNYVNITSGLLESNVKVSKGCERTLCYMRQSLIIVPLKAKPKVPMIIEPFSATITVPFMSEKECCEFVSLFLNHCEGVDVAPDSDGYLMAENRHFLSQIYYCLHGMTQRQILCTLNDCRMQLGNIYCTKDDADYDSRLAILKKCIRKFSNHIVETSRALIIENPSNKEPAGLSSLSEWLRKHRQQVANPRHFDRYCLEVPKGILVSGVPGSGKSMMAKFVAGCFGLSLVRLDFGNLGGSYVGQSEKNMDSALTMIEALSPCVLWVDEMEKAFSGASGNSSSDVTKRLFGKFLTWMQEKGERGVSCFVFATANDISKMPPEMFRSGRFDDKFFTFMPSAEECGKIFESIIEGQTIKSVKQSVRNLQAKPLFNCDRINASLFIGILNDKTKCLKGWPESETAECSVNRRNKFFTGADIEQVVKKAKTLFLNGFAIDEKTVGDAEFDSQRFIKCLEEAIAETRTYGETNLADIARCYAQLAVNNFSQASESCLLPFDGYDEMPAMARGTQTDTRLYNLDRYNHGAESHHYSTLKHRYDKCLYIMVRNAINNLSSELIKQRQQW